MQTATASTAVPVLKSLSLRPRSITPHTPPGLATSCSNRSTTPAARPLQTACCCCVHARAPAPALSHAAWRRLPTRTCRPRTRRTTTTTPPRTTRARRRTRPARHRRLRPRQAASGARAAAGHRRQPAPAACWCRSAYAGITPAHVCRRADGDEPAQPDLRDDGDDERLTPAQAAKRARISAVWDALQTAATGAPASRSLSRSSISLASLCSNTDPKKKRDTDKVRPRAAWRNGAAAQRCRPCCWRSMQLLLLQPAH